MATATHTPDLFISYSRKDQQKADVLTKLLVAQGWEVWKDNRLAAGEAFETKIIEALNYARAVLVLWTKHAVQSPWVMKEVALAVKQNKLKPVLLEPCDVPVAFRKYEMALLSTWKGEEQHPELNVLYDGITASVVPSRLDNVRKGYDPFFLRKNFKIMLPEVKGAADLIHYANFSVVMNPQRRMAWYVAYNVDATLLQEGLPRNEFWMPDPLWPASLQPSNAHFHHSDWDRGHLLSPSTVAWGEKRLAAIARRQANYWTNTSPTSRRMNTIWWLALEKCERNLARQRKKLTGFSGPVFGVKDEAFRDTFEKDGMFIARETFRIPRAYWKVIITASGKQPECICFLLDQYALSRSPTKFDLRHHTLTLRQLEKLTGLTFPDNVRKLPHPAFSNYFAD